MYSTHDEGKSTVAKRLIRTLRNNIYKHMTAVSKIMYIDKLDDIVNEHNNTYHRRIKIKPIDVKYNTYIYSIKEVNDKDPNFQVDDHVRISKNKKVFTKGYTPNRSEDVFVIKEVNNTVPTTYVINDFNGGVKIIGRFYEKEFQKASQKEFRIENVIKRKGSKLYIKWKGYDNSFNSWAELIE